MKDENGVIVCDLCDKVPAEFSVGMDSRAKEDFGMEVGDLHACPECLPRAIRIGKRVFIELSVGLIGDGK